MFWRASHCASRWNSRSPESALKRPELLESRTKRESILRVGEQALASRRRAQARASAIFFQFDSISFGLVFGRNDLVFVSRVVLEILEISPDRESRARRSGDKVAVTSGRARQRACARRGQGFPCDEFRRGGGSRLRNATSRASRVSGINRVRDPGRTPSERARARTRSPLSRALRRGS